MFDKIKKFWSHRIFVSVALSETGAVRGMRLHTATLASIFIGVFVLTIFMTFTTIGVNMSGELKELANYKGQVKDLEDTNTYREQQVKIIAQELGILQARLDRFDVIGERLFNDEVIGQRLREVGDEIEGKGGVTLPDEVTVVPDLGTVQSQLSILMDRFEHVEAGMSAGLQLIDQKAKDSTGQPSIWPVVHKLTRRTSHYGWRKDPIRKTRSWHGGVDIAGGYGAPIISTNDGVVVFSGYRYKYGIMVEIRHANGYATRYAHLQKATAQDGQTVKTGDLIGLMGSTGRSTGPHLHYEVLVNDIKVNPFQFIKGKHRAARQKARDGMTEQLLASAK